MILEYNPNKPNWYYSYVNIPNLEKIKEELLFVRENVSPSSLTQIHYSAYFTKDVVDYVPNLYEYLKSVGLHEKLHYILFSAKNAPGTPLQKSNIHIDHIDKRITHSLNIPLLDCENTHTVWYKGQVRFLVEKVLSSGVKQLKHYALLDEELATEMCRVETVRPMLVNTSIPHRGIHNCPTRILSGIRFLPDLTDAEVQRICNVD